MDAGLLKVHKKYCKSFYPLFVNTICSVFTDQKNKYESHYNVQMPNLISHKTPSPRVISSLFYCSRLWQPSIFFIMSLYPPLQSTNSNNVGKITQFSIYQIYERKSSDTQYLRGSAQTCSLHGLLQLFH